MKPVAIFQHTRVGKPGAVVPVLDALGIPWVLIPMMDGVSVPKDVSDYSGLVFMGGSMGVNDRLPWIDEEISLIQRAHQAGLAVAGHCLGSQMLASAFGAEVTQNHHTEIGWQTIHLDAVPQATEWFGRQRPEHLVLQWHGDTFALPSSAVRVASGKYCVNQAFVLHDRHLGMQFHLEMTPRLINLLLQANSEMLDRELVAGNPAVNARREILSSMQERTADMHVLLTNVYTRWAKGLKK